MTAGRRTRIKSIATTTAKPLRNAVRTTGRRGRSRRLGACMPVRRRTGRLCFVVSRRYLMGISADADQYGWRNPTSGRPHVPDELTYRTRSLYVPDGSLVARPSRTVAARDVARPGYSTETG